MTDKISFHTCSREGQMNAIAQELQHIVEEVAQPLDPREHISQRIERAWRNLGRPPRWRVKAAWYGEAGAWSAQAYLDFKERAAAFQAKRTTEATTHDAHTALAALRERLAASDPDFYREQIAAIDQALGR